MFKVENLNSKFLREKTINATNESKLPNISVTIRTLVKFFSTIHLINFCVIAIKTIKPAYS